MSLDEKVRDACHRIEDLWHETDGKCFVSFSGGKDSTVILALIKLCEEVYTIPPNGIPAVFSNTGIELGVTVDFVKWVKDTWYPNVITVIPEKTFDWVIKNKGKPIKSKMRSEFLYRYHTDGKRTENVMKSLVYGVTNTGKRAKRTVLADKDMHMLHDAFLIRPSQDCCKVLKKEPFAKYERENNMNGSMYGTRVAEGGAREMTYAIHGMNSAKPCTSISSGKIRKRPIYDWTDEDLEDFIEKYNVPLSDAYTKYGLKRTGCMGCPFSKNLTDSLGYLYLHEPNRYKASMHWLKDVYIAQDVRVPFDEAYEREREREWFERYEPMRQEMLRKYRPNSRLIKDHEQITIFDI